MTTPNGNLDIVLLWTALHSDSGPARPLPTPVPNMVGEVLNYLEDLPDPLGRVIRLRYFEHQSIPTIALSLHCSKGTVRNLLDKSLHRLRKRFDPAYQERLTVIKKRTSTAP